MTSGRETWTTLYHPKSDGFIEQSFRTLGRCLKAACRETRQEWDKLVPLILMSYQATPQASMGVTPNMMMLGRQTRVLIQAMYGSPLWAGRGRANCERVWGGAPGRMARSRGENTRWESWYGPTISHSGETRGTKLQFPWCDPVLITKVLDRG